MVVRKEVARKKALRKDAAHEKGFTLIELIMIIVVVGIVFPAILAPFMQSARQTATPANISSLTMVARGNMEIELDDFCDTSEVPPLNWPSEDAVSPGAYQKIVPTDTTMNANDVNYISAAGNLTFTTTIEGKFYESDLATVVDDTVDGIFDANGTGTDGYLVITLTTTIDGTDDSVTLQAVKSKSYTSSKCS